MYSTVLYFIILYCANNVTFPYPLAILVTAWGSTEHRTLYAVGITESFIFKLSNEDKCVRTNALDLMGGEFIVTGSV